MIHHVTTKGEWESSDEFFYSPYKFAEEGFIHCCSPEQLNGVLQRYFLGQTDLLVLHIDESKVASELRYERGTNNELFPHVYGNINKEAITKVEKL